LIEIAVVRQATILDGAPRRFNAGEYDRGMKAFVRRVVTTIQLTRLTMAFGAVSDVWLVVILARMGGLRDEAIPVTLMPLWLALALAAVVAVGLFAYGASLNDVLDARHDSAFSPQRPIPAGRIRPAQAMVVAVSALLAAIVAAQTFGSWSLLAALVAAIGILFYDAAGRFIPAVGIVTIGLIHAVHMVIPHPQLSLTWPVWFVMTHATAVAYGAYVLEGKRPRITQAALASIAAGWVFWSAAVIAWGVARDGAWIEGMSPGALAWPLASAISFIAVMRLKLAAIPGPAAAEKLRRYGAMWQSLHGAAWLAAVGLSTEAGWIAAFALAGFLVMTALRELSAHAAHPPAFRE